MGGKGRRNGKKRKKGGRKGREKGREGEGREGDGCFMAFGGWTPLHAFSSGDIWSYKILKSNSSRK